MIDLLTEFLQLINRHFLSIEGCPNNQSDISSLMRCRYIVFFYFFISRNIIIHSSTIIDYTELFYRFHVSINDMNMRHYISLELYKNQLTKIEFIKGGGRDT